jgi:hypothetical protein
MRPLSDHQQQEAQTSSVLERLLPRAQATPGYLASRSHHKHYKPAARARLLCLEQRVLLVVVVDRDWELASLDNNQRLV